MNSIKSPKPALLGPVLLTASLRGALAAPYPLCRAPLSVQARPSKVSRLSDYVLKEVRGDDTINGIGVLLFEGKEREGLARKVLVKTFKKKYLCDRKASKEALGMQVRAAQVGSLGTGNGILPLLEMFETKDEVCLVFEGGEIVAGVMIEQMIEVKKIILSAILAMSTIHALELCSLSLSLNNVVKTENGIYKLFNFTQLYQASSKMPKKWSHTRTTDPIVMSTNRITKSVDSWNIGVLLYECLSHFDEDLSEFNSAQFLSKKPNIAVDPSTKDILYGLLTQNMQERLMVEILPLHSIFNQLYYRHPETEDIVTKVLNYGGNLGEIRASICLARDCPKKIDINETIDKCASKMNSIYESSKKSRKRNSVADYLSERCSFSNGSRKRVSLHPPGVGFVKRKSAFSKNEYSESKIQKTSIRKYSEEKTKLTIASSKRRKSKNPGKRNAAHSQQISSIQNTEKSFLGKIFAALGCSEYRD